MHKSGWQVLVNFLFLHETLKAVVISKKMRPIRANWCLLRVASVFVCRALQQYAGREAIIILQQYTEREAIILQQYTEREAIILQQYTEREAMILRKIAVSNNGISLL